MAFPLAAHPALTAVPVGLAFGVILERAGLGDPRVIRGQLLGRDFTVVLVMFGAIVTAMIGLLWADALGVVDLRAVATPPTDIGGQVIGALIFGAGFGIAALCPGTACVAAASGRRDGVAAVVGVLLGTLLTALLWPVFAPVVAEVPQEHRLLSADLGLPVWVVATTLLLFALAARRIAERVQAAPDRPAWWRVRPIEAAALTLTLAYGVIESRPAAGAPQLSSVAGEIVREEDHVDPIELAEWIRAARPGLRILDLREGLDTSAYLIPGARITSMSSLSSLEVSPRELVVLYTDGGAHGAQAWVLLRLRGLTNVRVLKDGMAAWEDDVMSPALGGDTTAAGRARDAHLRELSTWFGGQPRTATGGVPLSLRPGSVVPRRRRNTC